MISPTGPSSGGSLFKRVSGVISSKVTTDSLGMPVGRCASVVVAAADSSALSKQQADYICPGIADQTMIQTAVDAAGDIYFMDGDYSKSNVAAITIPSNTRLYLAANAEIKFIDDVGDGAVVFANAGISGDGNKNIHIIGGIIDGNISGQSAGTQHGIHFEKVWDCRVDSIVRNFNGCNFKRLVQLGGNTYINRLYPHALINERSIYAPATEHPSMHKLADFETDWTVAWGTVSYDTDITHRENRSMKYTTTGGNAVSAGCVVDLDLSKSSVRLWVYMENAALIANLQVFLRSGGDWDNYATIQSDRGGGLPEVSGKWVEVEFVYPTALDGTPDFQAIDFIRIAANPYAGQTTNVYFGGISYIKRTTTPNGAVTFIFDDGHESHFTKAKPLLDKYGYAGVAALFNNSGLPFSEAYTETLKTAERCGWDMVCHSKDHDAVPTAGYYDPSELEGFFEEQLLASQSYLHEHGFSGAKFYVFPGGVNCAASLKIIEKYFAFARLSRNDRGFNSIPPVAFMDSWAIHASYSVADICAVIDTAKLYGIWLTLEFHVIYDSGAGDIDYNKADLEAIIDHCNSIDIPVITYSDVWKMANMPIHQTQQTDLFMDVLAVSATHVRSNEDLSAAIPLTFTLDAQPDVPRTLSWAFDTHNNISAYTIEIVGANAMGTTISETLTQADGWSGETNHAFATITSIKMTSRTGTGAGPDTMDFGITDVLGLSNVIFDISDIFKIKKNNADATVAAAQINTLYNTYDMSVIGLGAADDFTIWYTTRSLTSI